MSAHERPNYLAIILWLSGLTALELVVPMVIHAPGPKISLLIALAVTKAAMVGLYFMHLRFEKRILGIIAVTPMVICAFLLFMLLPDMSWRWIGG